MTYYTLDGYAVESPSGPVAHIEIGPDEWEPLDTPRPRRGVSRGTRRKIVAALATVVIGSTPGSVAPTPAVTPMDRTEFARTTLVAIANNDARTVAGRLTRHGVEATVDEGVRLGLVPAGTPRTLAGAEAVVNALWERLTPEERDAVGRANPYPKRLRVDGATSDTPAYVYDIDSSAADSALGGQRGPDAAFYVDPATMGTPGQPGVHSVVFDSRAAKWVLSSPPMSALPSAARERLVEGLTPTIASTPISGTGASPARAGQLGAAHAGRTDRRQHGR